MNGACCLSHMAKVNADFYKYWVPVDSMYMRIATELNVLKMTPDHQCALPKSHFQVCRELIKNNLCVHTENIATRKKKSWSDQVIIPRLSLPDTLHWRHNGLDSVSNHQPHDCLRKRLFMRRSKKTSKPRVTGLYVGNSPETGEFPAQRASNADNVSIWWRHHVYKILSSLNYCHLYHLYIQKHMYSKTDFHKTSNMSSLTVCKMDFRSTEHNDESGLHTSLHAIVVLFADISKCIFAVIFSICIQITEIVFMSRIDESTAGQGMVWRRISAQPLSKIILTKFLHTCKWDVLVAVSQVWWCRHKDEVKTWF